MSNFIFCPFFVQFSFLSIFVKFWSIFQFLSNFQFCPIFVQFSILSRAIDWNFQSCFKDFFDDFRRVFYARIVSMMKAKLDYWVILASIIMKQAVLNMPTYETAIANANKSISLRFFYFSDKKPSFLLHHSLENMIKEPFWKLTQSWCFKITNIVSYLNFHAKNLNFRAKSGQK